MPFIRVSANVTVSDGQAQQIQKMLGQAIPVLPGKSEQWLMVEVRSDAALWLAGSDEPAAIAEVSLYGAAPAQAYDTLTGRITDILDSTLDIAPDRVYVKYAETEHWGWNGSNF